MCSDRAAVIESQQPFPYVHLLSIIVDVAMCVNAMSVGVHHGREFWGSGSVASAVSLCIIGLLRVLVFTVVYNGLIGLGICLDNPLTSHSSMSSGADLPGLAFHYSLQAECKAFAEAAQVHDKEWFTSRFEVKEGK